MVAVCQCVCVCVHIMPEHTNTTTAPVKPLRAFHPASACYLSFARMAHMKKPCACNAMIHSGACNTVKRRTLTGSWPRRNVHRYTGI